MQCIYMVSDMYIWLHIAIYSHIHSDIHTQMVCEKTSQHNYSQEADARYTKLTKLRCNNTQLPHGGLQ